MKKKKASPITKLIKGLGGLYKSFFAATYLTYLAPGKQVGSFITIAILPVRSLSPSTPLAQTVPSLSSFSHTKNSTSAEPASRRVIHS